MLFVSFRFRMQLNIVIPLNVFAFCEESAHIFHTRTTQELQWLKVHTTPWPKAACRWYELHTNCVLAWKDLDKNRWSSPIKANGKLETAIKIIKFPLSSNSLPEGKLIKFLPQFGKLPAAASTCFRSSPAAAPRTWRPRFSDSRLKDGPLNDVLHRVTTMWLLCDF